MKKKEEEIIVTSELILDPVVEKGPVVEKAVDSLFGVAKKEIGYVWNSSENVENFRHEVQKLKVMRGKVQELIDASIRKGDKLLYGVEDWVKEADTQISKADEFLLEEANAEGINSPHLSLNWVTLLHYRKTAKKMFPSLLKLQERGSTYESRLSVETLAPGPQDAYQNKDVGDLHIHNSALNDIIAALEDGSKQIIGIYGLGGVGKTTLAKEVAARVKKTNLLFVDVAFTTVSQTVNAEKIQKDLENATNRIMNGDKILIILDDVWEKLNLDELCIPINHTNCKILLMSRSERLCQEMNAQSIIYVDCLPTKEAWILFRRIVGERVETEAHLKPVAEEVAKECGGLPLLIQAVGSALKYRSIDSWNSALSRLKTPAPSEIHPDIRKAFTGLHLSYDYLGSEEAKSCFLLCSLFPEDDDIALEDLVFYGVGLQKFKDYDSIEDARARVQNAVNILTSSGLLLKDDDEGWTKMHDVVRDVALLIASQGNNQFLVEAGKGLKEWLPRHNSLERYTGISLMYNDIIKLPDYKVNVPHLEIFLAQGNCHLSMISEEFIGCMKKVKVLNISWNNISSLPQSFQLLKKLRTLDLCGNESLCEISILGVMRDLEILFLNGTGITEIPIEIALLVNLRVLEVTDCDHLSRITHGVISSLWKLEELCIEFNTEFKEASNCIVEVVSLPKLTYLELIVPSIDDIPAQGQGFSCENLNGFVIQIGDEGPEYAFGSRSNRYLIISSEHLVIPLLKWLKKLIEVSRPITTLNEVQNLNNIMPTLYDEGFNKLECIKLSWCPNVSCLVDDGIRCDGDEGKIEEKFFKELKHLKLSYLVDLEVLWKCPDEYTSLTNLVSLSINGCDKLERVFTVSVAQSLVNLEKLDIKGCSGLKEVIWDGGVGDGVDEFQNVIVFPSLATISLIVLDRLKRFNSAGNCSIEYPSLVYVKIHDCERMKIWGPGIHETPNLKTLEMVYGEPITLDGPFAINEAMEKSWRKKWQVDEYEVDDYKVDDDDDDDGGGGGGGGDDDDDGGGGGGGDDDDGDGGRGGGGNVSVVTCVPLETLPPTQLEVYQAKNPEDLVIHNLALNAIIAALEDESKQIIGIYGLGGVGKTTLAKEVAARVRKTNLLFAEVAFTSVSQKVDVEKIKKDLENATKRMMKGDKILIILDDVWEKLNLEELGIQCGNNYMNCKILLTSRSEKVCQGMSAQSTIRANSLPTEEAWILFKRVVGERLETDANLKPVALKVVEECGGLPLLIQAIGNALKDESIESWESALSQLKKPAASEMERDTKKAFTRLQLSYEYLKSEEAKSCFLLCSFFAEDDDISLEHLVCYGVGLKMFDSMEDAREGVQNAVNILTSSGLLLNGKWEGYTKMHDVVRDVALLIVSKGENKFLVEAGKGLKEWLPGHNNLERYTGISLMNNKISKLPDYEVHLSSLDIFLVNNNPLLRMMSDEFIKGMKEVKVLDMGWCLISHLPQSLKLLTKLRMLNLEENYFFHEISILGEMKELEILILNRTGIKEIPIEIGWLVNLRRLEVSRCRYLTRVTPGVISKLKSLEELCIDFSRMSVGVDGCSAEVMTLSNLTYLDLVVKSCEVIPEGFNSEKLKGFVIQIGEYHRDFYRGNELRRSDRYLIISSKHLVIPLLKRIKKFIEVNCPITILNGIQNLNNIMPDLYCGGFNKLEHIQLNYCHNVSCLVEDGTRCDEDEGKIEGKFFKELKHLKLWYLDNLEVLWKYEYSLTNLVSLFIEGCDRLERVFTVSVAQSLVNLNKLDIERCDGLEEVIGGGGSGGGDESGNVIMFPSLATISLIELPRLKRFFNSAGNCSIEYPSLVYVKTHDCQSMKIWGPGNHKTPNLKSLEMDYGEPILVDGPLGINEAVKKSWRKWQVDVDDDNDDDYEDDNDDYDE